MSKHHVISARSNPLRFAKTAGVLLTASLALLGARAATLTWDADPGSGGPQDGNGNWDTNSANWWNGVTDIAWTNANGDSAIFGVPGGAGGTVNLPTASPNIVVANITFNTNYTLANSSGYLQLTNSPVLTAAAGTSNTILPVVTGSGFTKDGAGVIVLNPSFNNTYSGPTIINNGILQVGGNDSRVYVNGDLVINSGGVFRLTSGGSAGGVVPLTATIVVNGGNLLGNASGKYLYFNKLVLDNNGSVTVPDPPLGNFYFNPTNIDARSGRIYANLYRAITNNLFKSTAGTVIVSNRPNSSSTDGYLVTVNAGTLIFDKSSQSANRLLGNGVLNLGGGTLVLSNGNSTVNPSAENPGTGGTVLNPGASAVQGANAGASGGNVTFGAFTRKTGATFDASKTGAGAMATTTVNVNGILGGWATWAGSDWLSGTTLAAYSAYTTSPDPTTWAAANNVSLAGNPLANLDDTTINSLRLTAAATLTLNSGMTLTLASGGLLITGSGATAIAGGTLKGAAGADLVVLQNSSADLAISSDLADNTTATSLTKSGRGLLRLLGSNGMTGTNFLTGGITEVDTLSRLAAGPLIVNGGTLRYTGPNVTSTRAIGLYGLGAVIDVSASGATVTQSGMVSGSGAVLGDFGGLTKLGAGTLVLTASNYFTGPTIVSNGVLVVNGTNAFNAATWNGGTVSVYGGTLAGSGRINGPVAVKNGGVVSPGTDLGTLTLGTNLTFESGATAVFDVTNAPGTGDLLVVQGGLAATNTTISINVAGAPLAAGTYTLIQYAGKKSGSFNPVPVITGGTIDGSPVIDESTPGQINLVVSHELVITAQPADTVASTNGPASFTVAATGTAPIAYQWYFYGNNTNAAPVPLADATNATLAIPSAQGSDSGFYNVVLTNDYGAVTSRFAALFVGNVAPVVAGPASQTVIAGNSVTFTASVFGNPTPVLQWQTNGVDVAGATGASLTLTAVPYALDGASVSLIASNIAGVVTNTAQLTVIVAPAISQQPASLAVTTGGAAVFAVTATGVPAPAYQWRKNGTPISGATDSSWTIPSAQGGDIGIYSVVVTNAAGSITSSNAALTVYSSSLIATAFAPANGATDICVDSPLYVTLSGPVTNVAAGKVRIYSVANPATPVDTIDLSQNTFFSGSYIVQPRTIGGVALNSYPIICSGAQAAIYPHAGVLAAGQTYYVTIDGGVFADGSGAYFSGLTNAGVWQFTTKTTGPANATNLVVAADGSGDFATVQGAADFVPNANVNHTVINVRNGVYTEIVRLNSKNNVTFRGQDRQQTVIAYANWNGINPSTATRPMFGVLGANDVAIENLTLTNSTPNATGNNQAEALFVNVAKRFILFNCDLDSYQDTLLINQNGDQAYVQDSHIQGNTDFIWGQGTLYVTNTEIMFMPYQSAQDYLTQPRTPQYTNGFAFVECRLVGANPSVNNCYLGRDAGGTSFPYGSVAYINCVMDTNVVVPAGWALGSGTTLPQTANLRFWEYQSVDLSGAPINTAARASWSVQLDGATATNQVQNVTNWFGGWLPQLAPNILAQPVSQTNNAGQTASLSVGATGIPAPAYQWQRDGTNVDGATDALLSIPNAQPGDSGSYSVVVSNAAGVVTSAVAVLVVNPGPNTPPVFVAPIPNTNIVINAGVTLSVTNIAIDTNLPPQTLTYTLLSGPTNATLDGASGVFTWRPLVSQNDTSNQVVVAVFDNGTPSLGATQAFSVTVNLLAQPQITSPAWSGGLFGMVIDGQAGPDYAVQLSTNLTSWTTVFTTNSPALPFSWTDPNSGSYPAGFYRIIVGPPLP
jgi:autotransporter-associated beta strand protein